MSLHYKPVVSQKPFIVAQFTCFEDPKSGKCSTVPLVPITVCPCGADGCKDGQNCDVTIHRERKRKHPKNLTVLEMYCATHKLFFTVYPVGYTPYGRQQLVELDALGFEIEHEGTASAEAASLESYDIAEAERVLSAEASSQKDGEMTSKINECTVSDTERPLISTFFLQSYA